MMRALELVASPQAEVLVDAQESKLQPLVARKGVLRRRVVNDLWISNGVAPAEVSDGRRTGSDHIPVPAGVLTQREGHEEGVAVGPHTERAGVGAARATAAMPKDAHDRHPPPARDQHDRWIHEPRHEPDRASGSRAQPKTGTLDAGHG